MPSLAARPRDSASAEPAVALGEPPVRLTRPALFLDMDGVLAPLAETPEAVVANPRRTAVLRRLAAALQGRLAIVSGRTLTEIDRLTDSAVTAASGVHGLERRRADSSTEAADASPAMQAAVTELTDFASENPGVRVEDKTVAVGLHYRQAPEAGEAATDLAEAVAAKTGLSVQAGHMVVELKTPGSDKGVALAAFMAEAPFAGAMPIMLGDDQTDEHAFKAAARLGGFGVLVGLPRATAASHGLADVDAVLNWLEAVATEAEKTMETKA